MSVFMSTCCTLILVMSCFWFVVWFEFMFDRCFTLFDRYVLAVRRCLRDALRKWQVQYVTDFGISIGEGYFSLLTILSL